MRVISWLAAKPVRFSRWFLLHAVSKQACNLTSPTEHWILPLYRAARQQFNQVSEKPVSSFSETSAIFYHTIRLHNTAAYLHTQGCREPLSSRIIKPIVDSISHRARACARADNCYTTHITATFLFSEAQSSVTIRGLWGFRDKLITFLIQFLALKRNFSSSLTDGNLEYILIVFLVSFKDVYFSRRRNWIIKPT